MASWTYSLAPQSLHCYSQILVIAALDDDTRTRMMYHRDGMKGKGIIAAAAAAAVILTSAVYLFFSVYLQPRTAETVRLGLQESYGDSLTFESILFNLLYSQAEVDHLSFIIPDRTHQQQYLVEAGHMHVQIPGRQLLVITPLSSGPLSISQASFTLSDFSLYLEGQLLFQAERVLIDFSGMFTQQTAQELSRGSWPTILEHVHHLTIEVHQGQPVITQLRQLLFAAAEQLVMGKSPLVIPSFIAAEIVPSGPEDVEINGVLTNSGGSASFFTLWSLRDARSLRQAQLLRLEAEVSDLSEGLEKHFGQKQFSLQYAP